MKTNCWFLTKIRFLQRGQSNAAIVVGTQIDEVQTGHGPVKTGGGFSVCVCQIAMTIPTTNKIGPATGISSISADTIKQEQPILRTSFWWTSAGIVPS